MARYYESYRILIIVTTLSGIYLQSIEKIFGHKWYVKSLKSLFFIPFVNLIIFWGSNAKFVFYDEAELSTKLFGFLLFIYGFMTTFTFISFYIHRVDLERIFELWEFSFSEELNSSERQELLNKNRKLTVKWLLAFGAPSIVCCIIYCSTFFLGSEKKMPHPSGIPYRHESPDFELVATVELLASTFGFSILITYDSMNMALLSMEEAQFIHLKKCFGRILDIFFITDSGEIRFKTRENLKVGVGEHYLDSWRVQEALKELEKNIQIWIKDHKQILSFHDDLQKIYSSSFSIKYLMFILIMCFCCFLAVTGALDAKDISISVIFIVNIYATFYINIKYADSTAEAAESLFEEAFAKHWYLFPKKITTALHIILMRCRRPVQYKILWLYPLNPRSFLKILTSAYTFFTFLLQVNRQRG